MRSSIAKSSFWRRRPPARPRSSGETRSSQFGFRGGTSTATTKKRVEGSDLAPGCEMTRRECRKGATAATIVGMLPKFSDQVTENTQIVREIAA
jgi:hypothetical protein